MREGTHRFAIGVFCNGNPVFIFNIIEATHAQVAIIIGLLAQAKHVLQDNHYFAADLRDKNGSKLSR